MLIEQDGTGRAHAVADASKKHLWPLFAFLKNQRLKPRSSQIFQLHKNSRLKKSKLRCRVGGRTAASALCSLIPSAVQHGCRKKLVILDS